MKTPDEIVQDATSEWANACGGPSVKWLAAERGRREGLLHAAKRLRELLPDVPRVPLSHMSVLRLVEELEAEAEGTHAATVSGS